MHNAKLQNRRCGNTSGAVVSTDSVVAHKNINMAGLNASLWGAV